MHVSDLSVAHVKALEYLKEKSKSVILNCGYGKGYSVLEILRIFKKIKKIAYNDYPDLWIDFRLASFFAIKKKQFNSLNNHLTFYRQSETSFDKRYNKYLNAAWWRRRNQAFDFLNQIDKKNTKNYQTFDYYLTRVINKLFSIF